MGRRADFYHLGFLRLFRWSLCWQNGPLLFRVVETFEYGAFPANRRFAAPTVHNYCGPRGDCAVDNTRWRSFEEDEQWKNIKKEAEKRKEEKMRWSIFAPR